MFAVPSPRAATGSVLRRLENTVSTAPAAARRTAAFIRGCGALLCLIVSLAVACPSVAQIASAEASPVTTLQVSLGKSAAVTMTGDVERIVVAQPDIAKVDQIGPHSLFIIGRDIGATNVLVYGRNAKLLEVINIQVGYDAAQLRGELAAMLPGEHIQVSNLNGGLLLRGFVTTPQAAAMASDLAERAAGSDATSILDVRPDQVLLEVQLIEASEETLRDIGVDVGVVGSDVAFRSGSGVIGAGPPHSVASVAGQLAGRKLDAALRSLEQRGSARIFARPQILALSGETASFRAGGEFPFPVPTRDGVTIEFKPYGTAISVLPTVQSNGLIRLDLTAEVNSIDPRNSLRIGNFTVPALSTRRASTSLELRDGERFAFAGLFSETEQDQVSQTPWAAKLPVVGHLFRAVRTKDQHLQLAIIVTAHVLEGPNTGASTPMDPDSLLADRPDVASAPTAPESIPEPRPRGLLSRIKSSPLVTMVTRRVTTLAHMAAQGPRKALGMVESFARRVVA